MEKQRLYYLDNIRGFLILLVILGHVIITFDVDWGHNLAFRYLSSFHMPLFMFVSGFLSYKAVLQWHTVKKRFLQCIVPFYAWGVLCACLSGGIERLVLMQMYPFSGGLWFLWALFFIVLIMQCCFVVACRCKVKMEYVVCLMSIFLLLLMVLTGGCKLFAAHCICWYFMFYAGGFFYRKYEARLQDNSQRYMFPMFALFLFFAWFWMQKEAPTFMPKGSSMMYSYAYRILTAGVAILAFMPLFKRYASRKCLAISILGGVRSASTLLISSLSMR